MCMGPQLWCEEVLAWPEKVLDATHYSSYMQVHELYKLRVATDWFKLHHAVYLACPESVAVISGQSFLVHTAVLYSIHAPLLNTLGPPHVLLLLATFTLNVPCLSSVKAGSSSAFSSPLSSLFPSSQVFSSCIFILYPIVLLSLNWSWPLFPIPPHAGYMVPLQPVFSNLYPVSFKIARKFLLLPNLLNLIEPDLHFKFLHCLLVVSTLILSIKVLL